MKEIYLGLFKEGWSLPCIDDMDFFYYLDLLLYKAQNTEKSYIDDLF